LRVHRISIGRRLTLCFLAIVLLMLAGSALLLWQFHLVRVQADRLNRMDQELIAVLRFQTSLRSLRNQLDGLAQARDKQLLSQSETLRAALLDDARQTQAAFDTLPPGLATDSTVLATLEAIRSSLPAHLEAIKTLARLGDSTALQAGLANQTGPLDFLSSELVKEVDTKVVAERAQAAQNFDHAEGRMFLIVSATGSITLLIAAVLGIVLTRSIAQPLEGLMEGSRALARGEFQHQISVIGSDELAQLAVAFNDTAARLREVYENLRSREESLREREKDLRIEIAERKHAEQDLQREKEYLDGLFELAPNAVILTDEEFNVMRVNKEFTRMFGYALEEAVGRWLPDLIVPEELRAGSRANRTAIAAGQTVYVESVRQRKDGVRLDISVVAAQIALDSEQVAIYLIYRDITERKKADEQLRRSEAFLLEAQRLSHSGSWRHDVLSGTVTISPEAERIFGVRPGEDSSTAQFYFSRIHPDDLAAVRKDYETAVAGKTDFDQNYRIVLPDGTTKHVHNLGHAIFREAGEVREYVGTAMDVTEQYLARAALETALEEIKRLKDQLHDENLALKEQIDRAFMFEEIVGSSPALQAVLSSIVKVAPTDSTVLITGETGTGKELIARAIHKRSQRSGRAFISVNCASIPPSLIASELFGHEKGAFTGALHQRQGRFELAHSGTIFLDEIGELPAETQIALLRVLQERQFERVGGSRVLSTDVRVIAATNRDLPAAVAAGTFRSDLYYRLNVFPIHVPPLRQRRDDIPMLVEYFVKRYAEKTGKRIRKIDKNTLEQCQAYRWPGNIRELQNIIERSVILGTGETFWIEKAWLGGQEVESRPEQLGPLTQTLQQQEKEIIEAALAQCNGKVAGAKGAAARLGIPRSTLDWKIKQLKITKHKFTR
jgi:PAS domain S-box-containing protein